jgi:hypothetical protein
MSEGSRRGGQKRGRACARHVSSPAGRAQQAKNTSRAAHSHRAGRVEDLKHALGSLDLNLFAVAVLDGWIVLSSLASARAHRRRAQTQTFSTKMPWTNWTVMADLPTPPEPRTTILNSLIGMFHVCFCFLTEAWTFFLLKKRKRGKTAKAEKKNPVFARMLGQVSIISIEQAKACRGRRGHEDFTS